MGSHPGGGVSRPGGHWTPNWALNTTLNPSLGTYTWSEYINHPRTLNLLADIPSQINFVFGCLLCISVLLKTLFDLFSSELGGEIGIGSHFFFRFEYIETPRLSYDARMSYHLTSSDFTLLLGPFACSSLICTLLLFTLSFHHYLLNFHFIC